MYLRIGCRRPLPHHQFTAQWAAEHVNAAAFLPGGDVLALPAASMFHDGCSPALGTQYRILVAVVVREAQRERERERFTARDRK